MCIRDSEYTPTFRNFQMHAFDYRYYEVRWLSPSYIIFILTNYFDLVRFVYCNNGFNIIKPTTRILYLLLIASFNYEIAMRDNESDSCSVRRRLPDKFPTTFFILFQTLPILNIYKSRSHWFQVCLLYTSIYNYINIKYINVIFKR